MSATHLITTQRKIAPTTTLVLILLTMAVIIPRAAAWNGNPAPHDDAHLILLKPHNFKHKKRESTRDPHSPVGRCIVLAKGTKSHLHVRHAGKYHVWLHVAGADQSSPLNVALLKNQNTVIQNPINDGDGNKKRGGPAGLRAYLKKAVDFSPDGPLRARQLGYEVEGGDSLSGAAKDDGPGLLEEIEQKERPPFYDVSRLEKVTGRRYYWWKAFTVDLQPGKYTLTVVPVGGSKKKNPARMDLAFLSTAPEYDTLYPSAGDFNYPPGTYVRFRIDSLPQDNTLQIRFGMHIHHVPFRAGPCQLAANGLFDRKTEGKPKPHTEIGFTRWYRLQDGEHVPLRGGGIGMKITLRERHGADGITQFAAAPHRDQILREFGWGEIDGLHISLNMDIANHLDKLRTFRDHEREHYRWALNAADEQLFPLAQGNLSFSNATGRCYGASRDYMYKVFRLLGFNAAATPQPELYHRLYGAEAQLGHYWPSGYLPFDEETARRKYEKNYRKYFEGKDKFRLARIFQIADEPGEIKREEMSAPAWRYIATDNGGRWRDLSGSSSLHTKKTDFHNCVFEGRFRLLEGRNFGLRVAEGNSEHPKKYGYWQLGVYGNPRYNDNNLLYGVGPGRGKGIQREGASVRGGTHHFKILYEENQATLYVDGRPMPTLRGIAPKGGFGIYGGPRKEVWDLKFRPIQKNESVKVEPGGAAGLLEDDDTDDGIGDLMIDAKKTPEWAKLKPLKKAIEEDWRFAGGISGAWEGFRRWIADRGFTPQFFGKNSWDEVPMITTQRIIRNKYDRRLYYWSRRYSAYLTPKMFSLAAAGLHKYAPNPDMKGFVALSGHSLYMRGPTMPLDMFHLARFGEGTNLMPGVSDWMTSSWNWDSHQAVAYSVAFYNSGGRNRGGERYSWPMMHCGWPTELRSYTQLANNVKYISYFWYGPVYVGTEWMWSESRYSYQAISDTINRAAQIDDIVAPGKMRPSRVALLYSRATEYWHPSHSFADKRSTFLNLSHDYFQPELVTDRQIIHGDALRYYDALYVLEPNVRREAAERIADWTEQGGLLWVASNAMTFDEFNEENDFLEELAGLKRIPPEKENVRSTRPNFEPVKTEAKISPHTVRARWPVEIECPGARIRGRYDDGEAAWVEKEVGDGRLVYLAHRPGLTCSANAKRAGPRFLWKDAPREPLTRPLFDGSVERELVLSRPTVMATPLTAENGTAIVLFNLQWEPMKDLKIGLKEPRRPHSVRRFDDLDLVEAQWEYKKGRVWIDVPQLDVRRGQIIVVRRKPAPEDPRMAKMRQRTERNLASEDPRALSAGAWFAGFFPEWSMGAGLIPLLEHNSWAVRRAAAASLGRLGHQNAAPEILKTFRKEKDAHVRADMLMALARLRHPQAVRLCREVLSENRNVIPRLEAMRALNTLKVSDAQEQYKNLTEACQETFENYRNHRDARFAGSAAKLGPAGGKDETQK
ncbi:MAG: HEAT repeat domain-containing protein [Candidatus Brocadiia bacterium]